MKTSKIQVSGNWLITFNDLPAEEPSKENVEQSYDYKEDLLQIRNEKSNLLIDVGWYPEGDYENGKLRICLFEGDFHGRLIKESSTKSLAEAILQIKMLIKE